MSRIICWFSCGAASAVATKLILQEKPERFDVRIVYIETGAEHSDNERFIADCENWYGQSITRIKNPRFEDAFDVWLKERYMSGPKGAPCTRELTKANVLAMVQGAGIELPAMYQLGFHNNNCIGCVKATSPAYWALVRKCFPREFYRIAGLARDIGARLAIVGREKGEDGKARNIRAFIDEIPRDQPTINPIAPACDFMCHFAEQEIAA